MRNSSHQYLFYIIVTLTILPFLILSNFNHPASDDYCYTNFVNNYGFWDAQIYHYFNWTGRYTATFLLTLDPIDYQELATYRILPILLFIFFFFSIFLFIKNLLPGTSRQTQLNLSFLILFLYIFLIPSMPEAFYWRAGSITYQLASILSLLFFAAILHMQPEQSLQRRIAYTLIACILSIITIGLNETSMIILLVITLLWNLDKIIFKKEKKIELGVIFFVTVAASAIVIFAPGNAVRMAEKPEKFQLLFSISEAIKIAILFSLNWIPMSILLITLFSSWLAKFSKAVKKHYNLEKLKLWHIFIYSLFLFSFIAVCFFPSFWSQGGRPPYRTINVIYLLFIFGLLILSVLIFIYLQNRNSSIPKLSIGLQLFLIFIISSIILLKPNNIKEAYLNLFKGTAYKYNLEMKERYQLLKECSQKNCIVSPLKNKPETILSMDLEPNPSYENFYYNECLAYYFGIDKVFVQKKKGE